MKLDFEPSRTFKQGLSFRWIYHDGMNALEVLIIFLFSLEPTTADNQCWNDAEIKRWNLCAFHKRILCKAQQPNYFVSVYIERLKSLCSIEILVGISNQSEIFEHICERFFKFSNTANLSSNSSHKSSMRKRFVDRYSTLRNLWLIEIVMPWTCSTICFSINTISITFRHLPTVICRNFNRNLRSRR